MSRPVIVTAENRVRGKCARRDLDGKACGGTVRQVGEDAKELRGPQIVQCEVCGDMLGLPSARQIVEEQESVGASRRHEQEAGW
jgi:hypothetical protein